MSLPRPDLHDPVVVTAAEAEELAAIGHFLLADASATGGALSAHRVRLARGTAGAVPHRHDRSSELFFVLDGCLDVLVGTHVVTARAGDLVVVPPRLPHAFAAHGNDAADALVVLTPGVERFEYLRRVERIRTGRADLDSLQSEQDRYDTHFLVSDAWQRARALAEK
jgi:mannose-6-phosphate isomerase-like protein (cupin superfamily)